MLKRSTLMSKRWLSVAFLVFCLITGMDALKTASWSLSGSGISGEIGQIDGWVQRLILAIATTLILLGVFFALGVLFAKVTTRIQTLQDTRAFSLSIQQLQILSPEGLSRGLLAIAKIARILLLLLSVAVYLAILPNFFPQTEFLGRRLVAYVVAVVGNFWGGILSYTPKLIAIILVLITVHFALRFLRIFFDALEAGQLTIPGFYREWVQPTYKLTQVLAVLLALTFVLPYLPGFGSPAFQGISLLFGALLTLGGAGTVSNLIGGFITIYTRAFQIGDRIRIGEYVGYVMEKTILSTRLRTSNNEIITIPNSSLVASTIVNYTATLRDVKQPLVLHVDLTLGYDIPWQKVHTALVAAARSTADVLDNPAPLVRQMGLSDFYIEYELRASTEAIGRVSEIYSELYQNILDQCHEHDIEILSPHYSNERSIP